MDLEPEVLQSEDGKLLVVDDNLPNLDLLTRHLKRRGYSTTVASSGKEALEKLRDQEFDLVLLDIMMPDIDGLKVLEVLRQMYSLAELPVILVTAKAGSHDLIEGLSRGANDYVTKPIDFNVMIARIQAQMRYLRAEKALRERKERYALAVRGANDGLWDWDVEKNQVYFSSRWQFMLGFEESERQGLPDTWFSRVHPEDLLQVKSSIDRCLRGDQEFFENEHRLLHQDGNYRWIYCRGLTGKDSRGKVNRIAGSKTDITDQRDNDTLTGLLNRTLLLERISLAFIRKNRNRDYIFGALAIDVDGFRKVNDLFGVKTGDQLLREIARRLEICLRQSDSVARLEKDIFAVLLDGLQGAREAVQVAQRIQRELALPYRLSDKETKITVCIGIVLVDTCVDSPDVFLEQAVDAMRVAKKNSPASFELVNEADLLPC